MIFVTTGTQAPFDRLIKAMDEVAPLLNQPVIAQVSSTNHISKNIKVIDFLTPKEFNAYMLTADLIVSHAGMGTIISALEIEKPIMVLPRLTKYKEHRSDHQLDTAKRFEALKYIHVVYDEFELKNKLSSMSIEDFKSLHKVGKYASNELIDSIQEFMDNEIAFES